MGFYSAILTAASRSAGSPGARQEMTIRSAIRDRFSPRPTSPPSGSEPAGDGSAPLVGEGDRLPFAGYDRLDAKQAKATLSDHSQIELEAVESYERSHKDRGPVLDKLRYMRGREPLAGYDALSVAQVVTALEGADLATIKKVRGYERKFANRPDVLAEIVRVHRERRATEPASAAPAYQPISARSVASARRDPAE